jgi:hypothetical protein
VLSIQQQRTIAITEKPHARSDPDRQLEEDSTSKNLARLSLRRERLVLDDAALDAAAPAPP